MPDEVLTASVRAELTQFRQGMQEMVRVTERASRESVVATGRLNSALQQTQREFRSTVTAAQAAATGLAGFAKQGLAIAGGLGIVASLSGVVSGLKSLVTSSVEAANRFAALTIGLKNATGSLVGAQQALGFVRAEATRLGLDVTTAAQQFTSLANATKGSALQGEATRTIFSALSEASRTLGLNTDQYGRALLAVSQIATKGRVQQEELLQLAEAGIPVYSALARELGVTTDALSKMIEKGQLSRDALLPLAQGLRKELGGAATEAAGLFQAATTRMGSATTEFLASLGRIITESPAIRGAIDGITASIQGLRNAAEAIRQAGLPATVARQQQLLEVLAGTNVRPEELSQAEQGRALGRDPSAHAGETLAARREDAVKAAEARRRFALDESRAAVARLGLPPVGLEVTPEESRAEITRLKRKQGITVEEEQQALFDADKRAAEAHKKAADEAKQRAQEGRALAQRQATEASQLAKDRVADIRRQQEAQEQADQARLASTRTVQREIQRLTLDTTEFEVLQLDERLEAFRAQGVAEHELVALREAKMQDLQAETERKTLAQFERIRGRAEEEHAQQEQETARTLKEQSREYERFAKDVENTTSRFLFDALSGRIQSFKDLLTSVKDFFLQTLSDMVATAITKPIIIPIVTALAEGFGLNQFLGIPGGIGGVGTAGTAGLVTQTSSVAQTLGLTSTGAIGSFLRTPIGPGFTSGAVPAGMQGPLQANGTFFSNQSTVGQTIGAGTAGFALGQTGTQVAGLTNKAESIGSSVGGVLGAVAGAYFGPLGSFLGGIAGSFLGGLAGSLFGGKPKPPEFRITQATAPRLGFTAGEGLTIPDVVPFTARATSLKGGAGAVNASIDAATSQLFGSLEGTLRQFPQLLQEKALPTLQGLSDTFANTFNLVKFKGGDIQKQVENYLNETLPNTFKNIFEPFVKTVERAAAMLKQYDDAIVALTQRQAQVLEGIRGARQTITEALFTPAQLFETRRDTLDTLVAQFRTGDNATRAALAPQITGLTQEVFRLSTAQEVLGEDRGALEALQQEMLGILTETEMGARSAYDAALQVTREQRDILLNLFTVETEQVNLLNQLNAHMSNLTGFLQPIGSFQTAPGQVHQIASTGLAMVHAGELIGRPGGGNSYQTAQYEIHVHPPAGSSPQAIAKATLDEARRIEQGRQRATRYRQHRTPGQI